MFGCGSRVPAPLQFMPSLQTKRGSSSRSITYYYVITDLRITVSMLHHKICHTLPELGQGKSNSNISHSLCSSLNILHLYIYQCICYPLHDVHVYTCIWRGVDMWCWLILLLFITSCFLLKVCLCCTCLSLVMRQLWKMCSNTSIAVNAFLTHSSTAYCSIKVVHDCVVCLR